MSSPIFVPVILTASGRNDSFFISELTLTNRGGEEVTLHYTYTAHRGGGSGTATDSLAPGRQRIASDAIGYLTNLGIPIPHSGNRLGTLRVEVSGSSNVGVSVRTTTSVPEGRAGLAYPGIAAAAGFEEVVYLCGLRQNSQDRSNVAFQNMGPPEDGPITLRATVFSGDPEISEGHVLEERILPPGGFHQYNGILNLAGFDNGYVKVERVRGTAPFYAYGVINDQGNSDGSFVFPLTAGSLTGTTGQTLPVIVETGEFTSELTVTNFSAEARTLQFSFVADGLTTSDRTARFNLKIEPGQQRIIPDVIDTQLRQEGMEGVSSSRGGLAGALFARVASGDMSGIVIGARTSASDGRGGHYGVFYYAAPDGETFTEEAWVEGLQQKQENRSNLALVNTGEVDSSPSVFQLDIYDGATGTLANTLTGLRVGARGWRQINGILGKYAPGATQGYVRIRKISGNNPFLAYGVINDGGAPGERSGDGAYLPAAERIHDPGTEAMKDREVLEVFYHATGGPYWNNRTRWLSDAPLSKWFGVETDGSGRVTHLALRNNGLSGTIPPELGRLTHLRELYLLYDDLTGAIPAELGQLARLERLVLSGTQLSGEIPAELGRLTHLQVLSLSDNQLSGEIPPELAGLTSLQELSLGGNHLRGAIPPELAGLTHLQDLHLWDNPLSGAIPKNLQQLSELSRLSIQGTNVCVPADAAFQAWLGTLSEFRSSGLVCGGTRRVLFSAVTYEVREGETVTVSVRVIDQTGDPVRSVAIALTATPGRGATAADFSGVPERVTIMAPLNEASFVVEAVEDDQVEQGERVVLSFARSLPPGTTAGDPDTATVTIHDPRTEGEIDREVLEALYHATGGAEWSDQTNWLSDAPLAEWFGVGTDESGRVTRLALSSNGLIGATPPELGQLGRLEWLDLGFNRLSGEIPPELGGLTQLQSLDLRGNRLSGAIPPSLGQLNQLERLFLGANRLSGGIPPELAGLARLERLDLGGNRLSRAIPPELGGLANLQGLFLGFNRLSGVIPPELGGLTELRELFLRGNRLSGAIPVELARLTQLQTLAFNGNELSGEIPPELAELINLRTLQFGGNRLSGTIPPELRQLPLRSLNLMATSVCVPEDEEFRAWSRTIDFVPSGSACGRPVAAMSPIDILVVYRPAARRFAGGTAEIETVIDLRIAETNQAYLDGGVNQRLVLVAREEVEYTEAGNPSADLARLVSASDGYMDEVHEIRDRAGADLVHLIVDVGGVARFARPFAISDAVGDSWTFAHELGHNMGLHHDRYETPSSIAFSYSHGYVNQQAFAEGAPASARWGTIMAYPTQCGDAGFVCEWILRFSNPNQTYRGDPLGVPGDQRTTAVDGPADAVRTLNITRHSVAAFRPRASGNQLTMSSTLSQARSMVRTGGAAALVPGGSLFWAIAPNAGGSASRQAGGALERATLRRREVSVDIERLDHVVNGGPIALRLNLFHDVVLMGIIERWTPTYSGGFALSGRLAGVAGGSVALVVNGSVVAGTVRFPGATYRIRLAGAGRHQILQVDPSQLLLGCETVRQTPGFDR